MATIKGGARSIEHAPARIRKLSSTDPRREAWLKEENRRYTIVAVDAQGRELIAEELPGRLLQTLSPKARRVVGIMLGLPAAVRREILGSFDKQGELKYPWPVTLAP